MTGDFSGYLHRYQGRAVSIVTWDHVRMLGTLSEIAHDSILMTGVLVRDSHEHDSWSEHLAVEDMLENRGDLWPEMVIQRNLISTVTLVDPRGVVKEPTPTHSPDHEISALPIFDDLADSPPAEPLEDHMSQESDAVCIELGVELVPLVNTSPDKSRPLKDQVRSVRMEMEKLLGFQLQPFRIRSSFELPFNHFRLLVHGTEVFRSELYRDKLMAILPEGTKELALGIATKDPAFGLDARWIEVADRPAAIAAGCTVVTPGSVIVTAVSEFLKPHASGLLTYEAVSTAVEHLRETHPVTVSELMSTPVSLRTLFEVLRHLVNQGVVIRHVRPILESVARHVEHTSSMDRLVASVRRDVSLMLVTGLVTPDGYVPAITVNQKLADSIVAAESSSNPVEPSFQMLKKRVQDILRKEGLSKAALLVPNAHRQVFAVLCRSLLPEMSVLGVDECSLKLKVRSIGTIEPVEPKVEAILESMPYSESADEDTSSSTEVTARRKPR